MSASSLAKDLGTKAQVYAAAGVPEYWVVDVRAEVVHAHTGPTSSGYAQVRSRGFDEPMEVAGLTVVLSELLGGPSA